MPGYTNTLSEEKSANSFGLRDNCYYCTVAALSGKTVAQLIKDTETMQNSGGASSQEIWDLFKDAGLPCRTSEFSDEKVVYDNLIRLHDGFSVGLEYKRENGTQHMIVATRDEKYVNNNVNSGAKCVDFQQSPPKVTGFPPEPNIVRYRVWHK